MTTCNTTNTKHDPQLSRIIEYFEERKPPLLWPGTEAAALFYLSEVGELAEAMLALDDQKPRSKRMGKKTRSILRSFAKMGYQADDTVRDMRGWVRNNNRVHSPDISGEIADNNMMLQILSDNLIGRSPEDCMIRKMRAQILRDKTRNEAKAENEQK